MSSKCVLAVLAGAFVGFAWLSISWMVLPWHTATLKGFENEDVVGAAIKSAAEKPGIYVYPEWTDDYETVAKKAEAGPFVFASVLPSGKAPEMLGSMVRGFLIQVVGALILCFLMLLVGGSDGRSQKRRVVLAVCLGLFAGLTANLANWNWWHFPLGFTVVAILDAVIEWTLAGLVMAKILQPKEVEIAG